MFNFLAFACRRFGYFFFIYARKDLYSWRFCSCRWPSVLTKISAIKSVFEKLAKGFTGSCGIAGNGFFWTLGFGAALVFAFGVAFGAAFAFALGALAFGFGAGGVSSGASSS